ncbi:MAG: Gfo/Idh/MocA family oxidoreductase [Caldilineaceae bacterium]
MPMYRNCVATGADIVAISRRNPGSGHGAREVRRAARLRTGGEMSSAPNLMRSSSAPLTTCMQADADPLWRGLHVMVEKPMALRSEDAWAMVGTADRAGRCLLVGYPNRMDGTLRTIKQMIDQGEIGQLRQISMSDAPFGAGL